MNLIEKAARASHDFFRTKYTLLPPWDELPPSAQDLARDHITAVLVSVREPTDEMVAAAQAKYEADLNGVGRTILGCTYMGMIDAAVGGA